MLTSVSVELVYVPKKTIRKNVANILNLGHSFCWMMYKEKDKKM